MAQPSDFQAAQPAMTAAAAAGSNRRNLITVFLGGGSCAHNTVIPRTGANRGHYTSIRPDLAIADNPATALNADWQLHPSLVGLKALWDAGKLAIIRNAGNLVFPTTRAQYLANSVQLPPQLYSHSDQQDLTETGIGNQPVADTGWQGRMGELLRPFNGTAELSPLISMAGPNDTFRAFDLRPMGLGPNGFSLRNGGYRLNTDIMGILDNVYNNVLFASPLIQEYCDAQVRSVAAAGIVNAARDAAANPTNIPDSSPLGQQMRMVMRLASSQATMEQRRSMFFLTHGSYDHHANQLTEEADRFNTLDPILKAAYDTSVTNGIDANTTFVVYSEFGRSLRQNGSGSDHGWGGHIFVFGGGVAGGFYGNDYSLSPAGPDIVLNQCHMIPTTPIDTVIASLASWMGVPDATSNGVNPMDLLVPNLQNFPVRNLNLFG